MSTCAVCLHPIMTKLMDFSSALFTPNQGTRVTSEPQKCESTCIWFNNNPNLPEKEMHQGEQEWSLQTGQSTAKSTYINLLGSTAKKKKRCLTLVSLRGHQDAANIAYLLATCLWVLLGCFGWRPTRRLARSMKFTFCYMCNKTSLKKHGGQIFMDLC